MQVTIVTKEGIKPTLVPENYTQQDLQNDYNYFIAQKLLTIMLQQAIISEEEFNKITQLNRKSFHPHLGEIMS